MDFIAFIAMVAAGYAVFSFVSRKLRKAGHGLVLRATTGAAVGLAAGVLTLIVFLETGLVDSGRDAGSDAETISRNEHTTAAQTDKFSEANVHSEKEGPDPWKDKRAEVEAGPDLGITPDQYAERFNDLMREAGQPYRIDPQVEVSNMAQDSFQSVLNEYLVITGSVKPKSGKVNSIMFIGQGDGTQASGARLLMTAAVAFAAVQADVSLDDMAALVLDLTEEAQTGEDSVKRILNGIQYSLTMSDYIGAMFTAEPL